VVPRPAPQPPPHSSEAVDDQRQVRLLRLLLGDRLLAVVRGSRLGQLVLFVCRSSLDQSAAFVEEAGRRSRASSPPACAVESPNSPCRAASLGKTARSRCRRRRPSSSATLVRIRLPSVAGFDRGERPLPLDRWTLVSPPTYFCVMKHLGRNVLARRAAPRFAGGGGHGPPFPDLLVGGELA